jgi:NAD(P)-dependent dehydrogenase (short-subunit alcohol dehydrogenase family)
MSVLDAFSLSGRVSVVTGANRGIGRALVTALAEAGSDVMLLVRDTGGADEPHGVRVNALAPGYIKTEMAPVDEPEFKRYWIDDAPMQRYAMPSELGPCVVFLASDASSFMTGEVV